MGPPAATEPAPGAAGRLRARFASITLQVENAIEDRPMNDRLPASEPMPLWGIVLTLIAVAMLVGLVLHFVAQIPQAPVRAQMNAPACEVAAACLPSAAATTLASR